jgi:hypothetical protein
MGHSFPWRYADGGYSTITTWWDTSHMVMVVQGETPAPGDFDLRYGRPRSRCTVRSFAKKITSKTGFEPGSLWATFLLYKVSNHSTTVGDFKFPFYTKFITILTQE